MGPEVPNLVITKYLFIPNFSSILESLSRIEQR